MVSISIMIIRKFDEFGLPNKRVKKPISPDILKEREEKKKELLQKNIKKQ